MYVCTYVGMFSMDVYKNMENKKLSHICSSVCYPIYVEEKGTGNMSNLLERYQLRKMDQS